MWTSDSHLQTIHVNRFVGYFVDWGGWSSITDAGESNMSVDSFQKQEDSNMSLGDSKSDSVYGDSNVGVCWCQTHNTFNFSL